jgi:hypothetical protein
MSVCRQTGSNSVTVSGLTQTLLSKPVEARCPNSPLSFILAGFAGDPVALTYRPQLASKLLNRNTLNMKILVCMKQVPQKDAPLKLNESGTWIRDDVSYKKKNIPAKS